MGENEAKNPQITVGLGDLLGCGYYRCAVPYKALSKEGFDIELTNKLHYDPDLVTHLSGVDVLVLQRQHNEVVLKIAGLMQEKGQKIVFELDDYFHDIPRNNPAGQSYLKGSEAVKNLEKFLQIADLVTVSTQGLKEQYQKFNENIHVCPNNLELESMVLGDIRPYEGGEFRLGWAGSSTHYDDFLTIVKPVSELMLDNPDISFYFIGHDYRKLLHPNVQKRCYHLGHTFPIENGKPLFYSPDGINPVLKYYDLLKSAKLHAAIAPVLQVTFNKCKCLDENTLVLSQKGIIKLKNIQIGEKIWNQGEYVEVEAVEVTETRMGYNFVTEDGFEIKMTPEHRMWVNDNEWKFAQDILVNDELKLQPEEVTHNNYQKCNWPADGRISRYADNRWDFLNSTNGPSVTINAAWGRILGAFAGDGSFNSSTVIQISCDGQDQDWIDLLVNDFKSIGLNPTTENITTFDGKVLRRRAIRVSSAHLVRFLISIGLGKWNENNHISRKFEIPEIIWLSPKDVQAAWLSGYFEADGCICENGQMNTVSKYKKLSQDVQRLLLTFGIVSKINTVYSKSQTSELNEYFRVSLRRAALDVFAEKITFCSNRKNKMLKIVHSKSHSNNYRNMQWHQKIIKIEECLIENPIDIQVTGEVFSAAGFVSHNSYVKLMEYGLAGIPWVATNFGPYQYYNQKGIEWDRSRPIGATADRNPEWKRAIKRMMTDEPYRQSLINNNFDFLKDNHIITQNIQLWKNAFASIGIYPGSTSGKFAENLVKSE